MHQWQHLLLSPQMAGYVPWLPFIPSYLVVLMTTLITTIDIDGYMCSSIGEHHTGSLITLSQGR